MTAGPSPLAAPYIQPAPALPLHLRSVIGGCIGNSIEWYDFLIYSVFAIYFAPAFFPADNSTAQLLSAAAVAAIGYGVRPLGSWLMGVYADRRGRRSALSLSISLMCVGSLMIAVTPTYAQIGLAAPGLLVLARLVQGLSMGGEYGTSATYLAEMAAPERRGFIVGFLQVSVVTGQLTALGILLLLGHLVLSPEAMESWGWRIPFFIGAILALFGFYIRHGIAETANFNGAEVKTERGSLALLAKHLPAIVYSVGVSIGGTVCFYTFTVYMQKFMANSLGFSKETASLTAAAALLCYLPLQPLMGAVSDRFGRKPVLIGFALSGTLFVVPLMTIMSHAHTPLIAFALNLAGLLMLSGFTSIHMVVKAELFPAEIRALGVGLPYAVTTAVLGGTTELLALKFKASGHESWFFWYVAGACLISLVSVLAMPETRWRSHMTVEAGGARGPNGSPRHRITKLS